MQAVCLAEYGDPGFLELVDVDEPHAGPAEVRVAAGVDWKICAGGRAR